MIICSFFININTRNIVKHANGGVQNNLRYKEIILTPPKIIDEKICKSKFKRSAKTAKELTKIEQYKQYKKESIIDDDVESSSILIR